MNYSDARRRQQVSRRRRRRTNTRRTTSSSSTMLFICCTVLHCSTLLLQGSRYSLGAEASSEEVRQLRRQKEQRKQQQQERDLAENKVITDLQPVLTRVEQGGASKVIGSISMASGSPWCGKNGKSKPMYWLVGHQSPE